MKKTISIAAVLVLLLAILPVTVLAASRTAKTTTKLDTRYAICGVEDCDIAGYHRHSGRNYCGHFYGDGHDYHELCTVEDCTETDIHEHDGVTYFPQDYAYDYDYYCNYNNRRSGGCCGR